MAYPVVHPNPPVVMQMMPTDAVTSYQHACPTSLIGRGSGQSLLALG